MTLGSIVMVVGKLDTRVRNDDERMGTLTGLYGDEAEVLLVNGDIWRGLKRELVVQEGQVTNEKK